ncbi:claudin-4-like [Pseudophryne corroboree]|uniref:claudin-4-like n=1 Tax=Pseudophryne corroboree TaxID=495146 RepID=UPI0030814B24
MLGMVLALVGWIGSIIVFALPMWRVTAFIGSNIVVAQIIWEGLWMNCLVQSTGQMLCKVYDSMLVLAKELLAARALCIICILVALLALLISIIGAKCTNCVENRKTKARVSMVSGMVFIVGSILLLIPVYWLAKSIIHDFYNPLVVEAQNRELGASIYIGWSSSALMLMGGVLLSCSGPKKDNVPYTARYTAATSQPHSD